MESSCQFIGSEAIEELEHKPILKKNTKDNKSDTENEDVKADKMLFLNEKEFLILQDDTKSVNSKQNDKLRSQLHASLILQKELPKQNFINSEILNTAEKIYEQSDLEGKISEKKFSFKNSD